MNNTLISVSDINNNMITFGSTGVLQIKGAQKKNFLSQVNKSVIFVAVEFLTLEYVMRLLTLKDLEKVKKVF